MESEGLGPGGSDMTRGVWPLFVGIGVGFLVLLAYGWGVAVGVKVTKRARAREHEAFRVLGEAALHAHEREGEAWRLAARAPTAELAAPLSADGPASLSPDHNRPSTPPVQAAELAHAHTRSALGDLRPAWGEYDLGDETSANMREPEAERPR